jgi:hypothetical protein
MDKVEKAFGAVEEDCGMVEKCVLPVGKKKINRPSYKALLKAEELAHVTTQHELYETIAKFRDYRNNKWWSRVWTFLTKSRGVLTITHTRAVKNKGFIISD